MAWDQLTDEQREIRDLVRTLARERIASRAAEIDESHEFPWDGVELYRDNDIFGLFFDEQYGGLGTGTLLALIAIEEVSKVCATSGLILAVQELGSLRVKPAGDEVYTVFAKPDPDAGHSGISAFVVEADSDGFEVARLEPKMGISGSTTG